MFCANDGVAVPDQASDFAVRDVGVDSDLYPVAFERIAGSRDEVKADFEILYLLKSGFESDGREVVEVCHAENVTADIECKHRVKTPGKFPEWRFLGDIAQRQVEIAQFLDIHARRSAIDSDDNGPLASVVAEFT